VKKNRHVQMLEKIKNEFRKEFEGFAAEDFILLTLASGLAGLTFGSLAEIFRFSYPQYVAAGSGGITAVSCYFVIKKTRQPKRTQRR